MIKGTYWINSIILKVIKARNIFGDISVVEISTALIFFKTLKELGKPGRHYT